MEIGISTFVETTPDVKTGEVISHAQRLREVVEEIVLSRSGRVGYFRSGRASPRRLCLRHLLQCYLLLLHLKQNEFGLTSAVTVLSSADPVRVFQDFATLDAISNGRAEIMAGRGSFIESFPLFGYDLNDYDELFEEKTRVVIENT